VEETEKGLVTSPWPSPAELVEGTAYSPEEQAFGLSLAPSNRKEKPCTKPNEQNSFVNWLTLNARNCFDEKMPHPNPSSGEGTAHKT
jgi:hypothetical protein